MNALSEFESIVFEGLPILCPIATTMHPGVTKHSSTATNREQELLGTVGVN